MFSRNIFLSCAVLCCLVPLPYAILFLQSSKKLVKPMDNKEKKSYSGYTKDRGKSSVAYAKRALKRVPLDLPIAKYEKLKTAAAAKNESVNGYIKKAIDLRMDSETQE
jgi:predicted HicB family RNase H-like nuclease